MTNEKPIRSMKEFYRRFLPNGLERRKKLIEQDKCPYCEQDLPPWHPIIRLRKLDELTKKKGSR